MSPWKRALSRYQTHPSPTITHLLLSIAESPSPFGEGPLLLTSMVVKLEDLKLRATWLVSSRTPFQRRLCGLGACALTVTTTPFFFFLSVYFLFKGLRIFKINFKLVYKILGSSRHFHTLSATLPSCSVYLTLPHNSPPLAFMPPSPISV